MSPTRKECKAIDSKSRKIARWYVYKSDFGDEVYHYHPQDGERLHLADFYPQGMAKCQTCEEEYYYEDVEE